MLVRGRSADNSDDRRESLALCLLCTLPYPTYLSMALCPPPLFCSMASRLPIPRYFFSLTPFYLPLHGVVSFSTLLLHGLQAAHPTVLLQPYAILPTSPWRCVLLHSSAPWPPGCPSHGTSSASPHPTYLSMALCPPPLF